MACPNGRLGGSLRSNSTRVYHHHSATAGEGSPLKSRLLGPQQGLAPGQKLSLAAVFVV